MNKNKIVAFWEWFTENNKKYLFLEDMEEEQMELVLNDLMNRLSDLSEGVFFLIGSDPDENATELILTANGDIDFFNDVEDIVDDAPEIEGWKIVKFKQPIGDDAEVEINGILFEALNMEFVPLEHPDFPDEVGVYIVFNEIKEEDYDVFMQGTFLILDALLGEQTVGQDIAYVALEEADKIDDEFNILPLIELKSYLQFKKEEEQ